MSSSAKRFFDNLTTVRAILAGVVGRTATVTTPKTLPKYSTHSRNSDQDTSLIDLAKRWFLTLTGSPVASSRGTARARWLTIFRTIKSSYATRSLDLTTHLAVFTAKSLRWRLTLRCLRASLFLNLILFWEPSFSFQFGLKYQHIYVMHTKVNYRTENAKNPTVPSPSLTFSQLGKEFVSFFALDSSHR